MIKREIKVNIKSFIIWLTILIGIFLVVFLVYPSIIQSDNIKEMDKMLEMFPEEMLKAFNMDLSSITSAYGWLKSEGFVFVLLIIGCYAGILGSNILLKEENDRTIEYLNSIPIKRKEIVLNKALVGISFVISMVLLLGIFNGIGLALSGDFDQKQYLFLSITPIFSSIVIFSLCMYLSTFTHKTKKMLGVSLGIVFLSYMLQMLSTIADSVSWLKYLSIFTLSDIRNVIEKSSVNPIMVIISFGLTCLLLSLAISHYNRKELIS